jgi:2-dehydro-3-deoxygalactonokinase
MASANIGLRELPYKELPIRADGSDLYCTWFAASVAFPHRLLLVSGVRSARDVMRGEETQLAGCPPVEGVHRFVFPGTHSKHILVDGQLAVDFQTYMTGEFFALLSRHSLLAKSVTENASAHPEAFARGVAEGAESGLLHSAFRVRTHQLFGVLNPHQNYHYLSGLLIGSELGSIVADRIPITIVGDASQVGQYHTAAAVLGLSAARTLDAGSVSIKGQCVVWSHFAKSDS